MSKEISKIIFRKNADGTTTKVLIKKVQKSIKLKAKTPQTPSQPVKPGREGTNLKPSSPTNAQRQDGRPSNRHTQGGRSQNSGSQYSRSQGSRFQGSRSQGSKPQNAKPQTTIHKPIIPKNSKLSANDLLSRPQSGAAEHKIVSGNPTLSKRHSSPRTPNSTLNSRPNTLNRTGKNGVFSLQAAPPKIDNKRGKIIISKKKTDDPNKGKSGAFYRRNDKTNYLGEKRINRKSYQSFEEKSGREKRIVDELAGVPKEIEIAEAVTIKELARKLNLKASTVMKKVFTLGVMNLTLNDNIDADSAQIVCAEFGCKARVVSLLKQTKIELEKGDEKDYVSRAPIVTVMGHVDHGKTTLLDSLQGTSTADSESGKITQHIGASRVSHKDAEVLFVDTPGHSAFSSMRSRGAKITDIVVLVVSAVDGVKPQTEEAIKHVKAAGCGLIVAVNKVDLPEADLEKVRADLSKYEIVSKQWGGEVPFYEVSALRKTGLDELMAGIGEMATELKITGNPKIKAYGYVIESKVNIGKGNTANVIITNGTLHQGESYICGKNTGRIRALFDEKGKKLKQAGPSSAVEIIGLSDPISSGELFQVTENEKESKKIAEKRLELERKQQAARVNLVTLSSLFDKIQEENIKELRLIIKSDTFGSTEAIQACMEMLKNDEIKANIVHSGVGAVNENDINLAFTTNSVIIAFKVASTTKIKKLANEKNIEIKYYDVIYDIVEDIKEGLTDILGEKVNELHRSHLEVKNVFKISGTGKIAGCEVLEGVVGNKHKARITRDGKILHVGDISTLRHFKNEAKEVESGKECGVSLRNFQNFKVGDKIETFEVEKVKKTLTIKED